MKKSELRQIIKEEITSVLKERSVWKSGEYEEISSNIVNIKNEITVYDEESYEEAMRLLNRLDEINNHLGTENID